MDEFKKLNNQPLKFVLADFRFSIVLDIETYIARLQDSLRSKFPLMANPKVDQSFQITPGQVSVSNVKKWAFISADKLSAVEVSQDRVVFYTSVYERFGSFRAAHHFD